VSTGNDIVALGATDSERTSRYRFYSRILTRTELQSFHHLPADAGISFSHYVWLMWSIKESAYKYCSRSETSLVFAPLTIPVVQVTHRGAGSWHGMVRYRGVLLHSRSLVRTGFISSVVSSEPDLGRTRHGVRRIPQADRSSQSALARKFALQSLASEFPVAAGGVAAALRIVRQPDGPPEVWAGEKLLDVPVSLAHHDCLVAWSYRLPESIS